MSSNLPGILGRIASVAGEAAALAIAGARGGTEVYVPPAPDADHWLSQLIGHEAALKVADELTCGVGIGSSFEVPLGPTGAAARLRRRIDEMILAGASERDIALASGYTTRAIRRRVAMLGCAEDRRQMRLL